MTSLEGRPRVVMRAHWPWQLYERSRDKGGVVADWYTLEGPTVVHHENRYYCFYSGGNYQNASYGVDYLTAEKITGPWTEAGKLDGPQVMRSIVGSVFGPGHNSVVKGPNGVDDYIVYHQWDADHTARQMWIDRLHWRNARPTVDRFHAAAEVRRTIAKE